MKPIGSTNRTSLANPEAADDVEVPLGRDPLQIIKQPPATTYHHEQSATARKVFGVLLEMFGQVSDPGSQQGNLHLCRTRIFLPTLVSANQLLLAILGQRHQCVRPPQATIGCFISQYEFVSVAAGRLFATGDRFHRSRRPTPWGVWTTFQASPSRSSSRITQ